MVDLSNSTYLHSWKMMWATNGYDDALGKMENLKVETAVAQLKNLVVMQKRNEVLELRAFASAAPTADILAIGLFKQPIDSLSVSAKGRLKKYEQARLSAISGSDPKVQVRFLQEIADLGGTFESENKKKKVRYQDSAYDEILKFLQKTVDGNLDASLSTAMIREADNATLVSMANTLNAIAHQATAEINRLAGSKGDEEDIGASIDIDAVAAMLAGTIKANKVILLQGILSSCGRAGEAIARKAAATTNAGMSELSRKDLYANEKTQDFLKKLEKQYNMEVFSTKGKTLADGGKSEADKRLNRKFGDLLCSVTIDSLRGTQSQQRGETGEKQLSSSINAIVGQMLESKITGNKVTHQGERFKSDIVINVKRTTDEGTHEASIGPTGIRVSVKTYSPRTDAIEIHGGGSIVALNKRLERMPAIKNNFDFSFLTNTSFQYVLLNALYQYNSGGKEMDKASRFRTAFLDALKVIGFAMIGGEMAEKLEDGTLLSDTRGDWVNFVFYGGEFIPLSSLYEKLIEGYQANKIDNLVFASLNSPRKAPVKDLMTHASGIMSDKRIYGRTVTPNSRYGSDWVGRYSASGRQYLMNNKISFRAKKSLLK